MFCRNLYTWYLVSNSRELHPRHVLLTPLRGTHDNDHRHPVLAVGIALFSAPKTFLTDGARQLRGGSQYGGVLTVGFGLLKIQNISH